ncbi:WD40 domain-containing protein [Blastocystis sp. ATCC 50177/Nand II]|uniref:WD40 domain-containing protein n=1 Tax=Blastocystis sp. subtype 1 (strain ATCC 50177 / NandII) TaxID=478820 RepID=A0A196SH73_BLAHN|nr:WD40 domain-containing protein [Blastocystis sp. ATCC 50177/Nand II]
MDSNLRIDESPRKKLEGHTEKIKCLDWSLSGNYLASGSKDRTVKIWNAKHHSRCDYSFSFKSTVLQVKWNPVKEEIIACTVEKDMVYIWNIENEESMMSVRIVGHPDYLSWSPDGKYMCVMNDRGVVFIIDAITCNITTVKSAGNQSVTRNDICWGLDSSCLYVASGTDDMGCVEIIEFNEESKEFAFANRLPISMGECNTIDIDRRHNLLAVGSSDSILTIIDFCEMIPVSSIKLHNTGIKRARWTFRGGYVAFCSSDNVITLVSPLTGEVKKNYQISEYSTVFSCCSKRCGVSVVMGKSDKDVKSIDIITV